MKHRIPCVLVALLLAASVVLAAEPAQPEIGYSGLVRIADDAYLVVHDRKDMLEHDHLPWLGTVTLSSSAGASYSELPITGMGSSDRLSDLEACCAIPGRPGEYLLAESGYYKGKYGRVVRIGIGKNENGVSEARVIDSFQPRPAPSSGSTPKPAQIEGMACVSTQDGRLVLLLGTLGGSGTAACLHWGHLDLDAVAPSRVFVPIGQAALNRGPAPLGDRGCAALRVMPSGRDWLIWSVATTDPGDAGPFRSQVYHAGILRRIRGPGLFCYAACTCPRSLWSVDGVKIEGIAEPPESIDGAGLCFATDDENYIGIVRLLHERGVHRR